MTSSIQHAALFREICASFAGAGWLQLLGLVAGDRTIAMECDLVAGDAIDCFKIADHDETLGRFSRP